MSGRSSGKCQCDGQGWRLLIVDEVRRPSIDHVYVYVLTAAKLLVAGQLAPDPPAPADDGAPAASFHAVTEAPLGSLDAAFANIDVHGLSSVGDYKEPPAKIKDQRRNFPRPRMS